MLDEIVTLAKYDNWQVSLEVDRNHFMAPDNRPPREDIIAKRLEMSHFS